MTLVFILYPLGAKYPPKAPVTEQLHYLLACDWLTISCCYDLHMGTRKRTVYRSGGRTGRSGVFSLSLGLGLFAIVVFLRVFRVLLVGAGYLEFYFNSAQVLFGVWRGRKSVVA